MKYLVVILVGLIGLSSCTAHKKDVYKLDVTVKGVDTGVVYLLEKGVGFAPMFNTKEAIDSAQIVHGHCLLESEILNPLMVTLLVKPSGEKSKIPFKQFTFVLENKNFDLVCDYAKNGSYLEGGRLKITGSPLNDMSVIFAQTLDPIKKEISKIKNEVRQAKSNQDADKQLSLNEALERLEASYLSYLTDFVEKNPKNIELCYLISDKYGSSYDYQMLDQLLSKVDSSMYQSIFLSRLVKKVDGWKRTKIGMIAPNISAKDVEGNLHSLSDLKGKYVLVDFWATWCGPCCKEIPEIVELYNRYKDKKFEVFGVSCDSDADRWKKAIGKYKMNWLNVSDLDHGERLTALYAINGIPYNVIVDPEGKIVAKDIHGEELEKTLEELLKN